MSTVNDDIKVIRKTQQTYDQIASGYSTRIDALVSDTWVGAFERQLLDKFLHMCMISTPRILDIGCGNGKDTYYLSQQKAIPIGIDNSRGMLMEAKKRVLENVLCQMDMRNLGFSNRVFDGVWANGCIYHVPKSDLVHVLNEVKRILKPSGIFSFNAKIGTGEKLEDNPRSFAGGSRFYAYYTIKEMKNSLRRVDFDVLETAEYPQKIFDERIFYVLARKTLADHNQRMPATIYLH